MEENKKLDDFISKSIKEVGLEMPSVDFTNSVASKIALKHPKEGALVTKPLLSKTTWFLILGAVVAIFTYVIFNNGTSQSTWLAVGQLNKLSSYNLSYQMPKLTFSITFVYGSVAIAVFGCIQVFLLKQKLDKWYLAG